VKLLYLHGFGSSLGGVKATFLKSHGHEVVEPELPDYKFRTCIGIAQAAFGETKPDVVVGSSRGGAIAMNISVRDTRLVLIAPAWNPLGKADTVPPSAIVLHSPNDDVIPFEHSRQLADRSGCRLVAVGEDHNMIDETALQALLRAVEGADGPGG
jgi:hypothetical protein